MALALPLCQTAAAGLAHHHNSPPGGEPQPGGEGDSDMAHSMYGRDEGSITPSEATVATDTAEQQTEKSNSGHWPLTAVFTPKILISKLHYPPITSNLLHHI